MSEISAKKALGQHWLDDQASLEAMAEAAAVQPGEVVLEIGPGLGSLTAVLLDRGAEVVALEFDQSLIPKLQQRFANYHDQLSLQSGDIRTFDFSNLPDDYKIVANIPYYLTANLMRLLTDPKTHKPLQAVLLLQKEVADRVAATPGAMVFLSVATQLYYEVGLGQAVPAELFTPPPKVNSQILILKKRSEILFPDIDLPKFFRILKAGFAQRRKTLLNSLSSGLHLSRDQTQAICHLARIDPKRRAQTLSLEEWHQLYLNLEPHTH